MAPQTYRYTQSRAAVVAPKHSARSIVAIATGVLLLAALLHAAGALSRDDDAVTATRSNPVADLSDP